MSKRYFVSRHAGALYWADVYLDYDVHLESLDPSIVARGDIVFGTLPISTAAEVVSKGARYVHLTLDIPQERRGEELGSEEMQTYGARLEEFHIERRPSDLDLSITQIPHQKSGGICMAVINSGETLANLVPLLHFSPIELVIFHTEAYADERRWLKFSISRHAKLASCSIKEFQIPSDFSGCVAAMETGLASIKKNARLIANVTSGMKPMSLALSETTRRHGGEVCYFDVASNCLDHIHPVSQPTPLTPNLLDIKTCLSSHGYPNHNIDTTNLNNSRIDKATALAQLFIEIGIGQVSKMHEIIRNMKSTDVLKMELDLDNVRKIDPKLVKFFVDNCCAITNAIGTITLVFQSDSERAFYGGNWYEYWVYAVAAGMGIGESVQGVELLAPDGKTEDEFDVLAIVNNRPVFIECKAANTSDKSEGKSKSWIDDLSAGGVRGGGQGSIKILISLRKLANRNHVARMNRSRIWLIEGPLTLNRNEMSKALQSAIVNGTKHQLLEPPNNQPRPPQRKSHSQQKKFARQFPTP